MSSKGNNSNNLDRMMSVRYEPKRNEITCEALNILEKFIESLYHKPVLQENIKYGIKNRKARLKYD